MKPLKRITRLWKRSNNTRWQRQSRRLNLLSRIVKVRLHGREIAADYDYEEIKEATAKVAAEKGDQNG